MHGFLGATQSEWVQLTAYLYQLKTSKLICAHFVFSLLVQLISVPAHVSVVLPAWKRLTCMNAQKYKL